MGPQAIFNWAKLPSSEKSVVNVWINADIRPLPPARRTWTTATFISFWLTNQIASMPSPVYFQSSTAITRYSARVPT